MYELRVCFVSWLDAQEEYSVQWAEYYEPYIVGAKSVMPEYDERFTGYGSEPYKPPNLLPLTIAHTGMNKIAHLMQVHMAGVLPFPSFAS